MLVWVATASAQVTAEVVLDQEHFLAGEEVTAAVRIINRSGQTLHLGDSPNWLTFAVEARDGLGVAKSGEVPVVKPFTLANGEMATRRVTLTPYFALDRIGRYRVSASIEIPGWDRTVAVVPKSFDVIKGARIWAQEFGLKLPAGVTNQTPEVRRYSLEQANHLRSQLQLYLRVTDMSDGNILKVTKIGPLVSFSQPEAQVDQNSHLHVLYQQNARTYLYTVLNPDGAILVQQTHEITSSRPRLAPDEFGSFYVMGGARRLTPNDLPALASEK